MSAPEAKRSCEMPSRLGDCQYRHDWIDGKCNTCGQIADAPEAKSQGEDESTLRLKIKELVKALQPYRMEHSQHNCYYSGSTGAICDECLAVDELLSRIPKELL